MVSNIQSKVYIESAPFVYDGNTTNNLSMMEYNEEIGITVISEEEAIERNFANVEIVWTLMVSCLNLIYKR